MRCDECGRKSTERTTIRSFTIREDTGDTYVVDLCSKCWDGIVKKAGIRSRETSKRREMVLTDPKDIR